jgi:mannitol 2-dehydrogenase
MTTKLSDANLKRLGPTVRVPAYDRGKVSASVVHIGVGGFHRAHQAVYTDDLLQFESESEWGLCGVGLLKHDARMRDVLLSQDCLYTMVERSSQGDNARVIGSLVDFLYAPADPQRVIERMSSPSCRIVSLTITEGGYYVHQGTGEFDEKHPDIQHDLAHPSEPICSFGYLAEALNRRRTRGIPPFTVMSCDNMQSNGDVIKKMLLAFTELRDPALSRWLSENSAFPNSMVDRITPATTDEHRALVRDRFDIDDGWPVVTEPFKQWVIEDQFPIGRPPWERVGAQMTSDVLPYEKMKIRLLNASHQAMCYIGMLLGYKYADEAMADPQIRKLVETMMEIEVTPLLPVVPGVDLTEYKRTLIERFANPAIRDQLSRIGTEGSARIPKFVLPSIIEQLERGGPIKILSFTVASWFRYLTGVDDQGNEMPLIDPLGNKLRERARTGGKDPQSLLAVGEVFSAALAKSQVFVDQVGEALRSLYEEGARVTLARYVQQESSRSESSRTQG